MTLGPGVAKEQLAHLETLVSGNVAMRHHEFVFLFGVLPILDCEQWKLTGHMEGGRQVT